MSKASLKAPSGFVEYSPNEQEVFDGLKSRIENTYIKLGFLKTETPAAELLSNLLAKGACDQEVFTLGRYGSDKPSDMGLRFDLTVPFARYVAAYQTEISFPFKRYQIAPVWRGERPQSGRYRQFYQCDVDIIAPENLSESYDSLMLYTLVQALSSIDITNIKVKVNHKGLLEAVGRHFGVSKDKSSEFYRVLDKKDKLSSDVFDSQLTDIIGSEYVAGLKDLLGSLEGKDFSNCIELLRKSFAEDQLVVDILDDLMKIYDSLLLMGLNTSILNFDLSIARGLNYYTGIIFETQWEDYPELGSIASGGRYNDLVSFFSKRPYRGIGFSIGLSRIFSVYSKHVKNESLMKGVLLSVDKNISSEHKKLHYQYYHKLVESCSVPVDIYLQEKKYQVQLKYAQDEKIRFFVTLVFDDSMPRFQIKDLLTGNSEVADYKKALELFNDC